MIELRAISKRYGSSHAVEELSLTVEAGELLVLLGSSGSGKTTTLKMVNRLIEPSDGRVLVAGRDTRDVDAHELRRGIGYCFQRIGLFPHMNVAGNIGITPSLLGWDPGRVARRVDELLEMVQLDPAEFRTRSPHELSGGQQQRVGLARALAAQPEVMLLDEPFGALDPLTRDSLQQSLQKLRRELSFTSMFVTHDMVEALLLGDRIAVMSEGRLVQLGTPSDLLRSPANDYVASLMDTPRRQTQALERLLASTGDDLGKH